MTTIIGMTWKEMLRKKVMLLTLLTLLMTVIFLVAFWFVAKSLGSTFIRNESQIDPNSAEYLIRHFTSGSVILTLGLFFGSFVLAFLSIFSSFSVIAGEAEQGVLQALLPRPIPRWHWYTGRWLGYVSLGIGYAGLLYGSIVVIADIHASVPLDAAALIRSFLLFASVVPLLISVSMLGSCFFSALGNGVFMTMLFGAGWLGGMIEKLESSLRLEDAVIKPLVTIAGLMSLLMPADALQRRMLAEIFNLAELGDLVNLNDTLGPFSLGQIPSNAFLIYSACYTLVALVLGMRMFWRKDL